MNKLILICFLLLSALNAWADDAPKQEPACRRENGRVSCSEAGFKVLTDSLIEYRAGEEKWVMRQQACVTTREATEASLTACEAARKLAEEKLAAIPQPGPLKPVLALTGAVFGALAMTASFVMTDLPPQVRFGMGAGGVAALALGYVFVLPEKLEK